MPLLTSACMPLHRSKNPSSAPDALIVSIMSMPETVVELSRPASRTCWRMTFTRFFEIWRAKKAFNTTVATPMSASGALYSTMTTKYRTMSTQFISDGASSCTTVMAMDSLAACRCCKSPTWRWA